MKGGGHTTNPGFSSTSGMQIALSRFNSTKVKANDRTIKIGPGLTWGQVYKTLGPTGMNVVGGRVTSVGVVGLTLGGGKCLRWSDGSESQMVAGYSFKSNQFGLAIDNVAGYELVLPNGTIKHVTQKDKDLWFGLRVSRKGSIRVGDANGL